MSKIEIKRRHLTALATLDDAIEKLNNEKVRLMFEIIGLQTNAADFEQLTAWELILVTVQDKQMAVQLNRLCAYVPNLKFVVNPAEALFTVRQGDKGRRVWKER